MKHVTVLSIPPTLDIINSGSGFGDEVINSNEATYIELQNRCCHVNTDHEIYLVEQVNSESGDQNTGETVESSSKGRSRTKHVENWSKNVRKRKCQAGKEYTSSRGKQVSKKSIKLKKDCTGKCRYTCARTFCKEEIEAIHSKFWALNNDNKYLFYARTTEKRENVMKKELSRRKYTYTYSLMICQDRVQVCKEFYFGVLGIDESRFRKFYEKTEQDGAGNVQDMRGKRTSRRTPQDAIERVSSHINSFPRVPSHYCRSSSTKEYLEPGLSLTMMYELSCEVCDKVPVKLSMYRTIFQNEFNISFKMPKKDANDAACDEKNQAHILDKTHSKTERDKDRKRPNTATICFDLQNVITLPRAEIKNFFYKRKLNVYNLTEHFSVDKHVYNAIW